MDDCFFFLFFYNFAIFQTNIYMPLEIFEMNCILAQYWWSNEYKVGFLQKMLTCIIIFFFFNFYHGKLFDVMNIIKYWGIKILHILLYFLSSFLKMHVYNTTAIPSTTNFWRERSFFVLNFVQDEFLSRLD